MKYIKVGSIIRETETEAKEVIILENDNCEFKVWDRASKMGVKGSSFTDGVLADYADILEGYMKELWTHLDSRTDCDKVDNVEFTYLCRQAWSRNFGSYIGEVAVLGFGDSQDSAMINCAARQIRLWEWFLPAFLDKKKKEGLDVPEPYPVVNQQCEKCGQQFPVMYCPKGDFELIKGQPACGCLAGFSPVDGPSMGEWLDGLRRWVSEC